MYRHIRTSICCLLTASLVLVACRGQNSATDTGKDRSGADSSGLDDADATARDLSDVECDRRDENCPAEACENRAPTDEICNGKDDDCDGETDENLTKKCELQKGVCKGSTTKCIGGSFPSCGSSEYGADYQENEVKCDGKDNDCDGTTDPMSEDCGWTRMVGADQQDKVEGVSTTSGGEVYVAGATQSSLDGQKYAGGNSDAFLMRFSGAGDLVWTRLIGSPGADDGVSVAATDDGNVYVAGDVTDELNQHSTSGPSDAFLVKYSASGARQWTRLVGTDGREKATDLAVDGDGNTYLVGWTPKGLHGRTYNGGPQDGFIVKFDSTGSRVWTRLVGNSTQDIVSAAETDEDGNVYVAGSTEADLYGRDHAGEDDGFVVKLDGTGGRSWTRLIGSTGKQYARGLAVEGLGNVYVAGSTDEALDGRPFNGGDRDTFVAQYDRRGSKNWTRLVGSSESEKASDVTYRQGGSVYLVGQTSESINFQPYNGGISDGFLVQFDASGAEQSTELVGTSGQDCTNAVDVNDKNHLYHVGSAAEGINGRPFNGGLIDGFLVRQY